MTRRRYKSFFIDDFDMLPTKRRVAKQHAFIDRSRAHAIVKCDRKWKDRQWKKRAACSAGLRSARFIVVGLPIAKALRYKFSEDYYRSLVTTFLNVWDK